MRVNPMLFGYNLECTRRVGYGGLYAEMLVNRKFASGTEGFYPVEIDGLSGWGQSTELICLQAGKTYELRAYGGEKIRMRLRAEHGMGVLFECEGGYARFTASTTYYHARFEAVSDAPLTCVSLRPADALFGCRKDVLDLIKSLKPAFLRVPGGCFAEIYNWKDGLLPVDDRPSIMDGGLTFVMSASCGNDAYELGIDEYAAICRYVGAEMEFTVRLSENTPQDAAELVEYCNGGADTPMGRLRCDRGHPEPYNVKTWCVGNELAFFGRGGLKEADTAAAANDEFARAMKKADPSIRLVSSTGNIHEWDERFVKCAREIQMCAHHFYLVEEVPNATLQQALTAAEEVTLPRLRKARSILGDAPLRFDEWNLLWGSWGCALSAVYAASMLHVLIRHTEELKLDGAAYFTPVNEGAIRVYPDHAALAPDGEVFLRMARHAGGEVVSCPDLPTAIRTRHEGYDYMSVCNPSADNPMKLTGAAGEYEILIPEGDGIRMEKGTGELSGLPPASVAWITIR